MPTPSPSPRGLRPHKELLIAWILLLLSDGALHGYKLHEELHARGLAVQQASLYRWLRKFERDRWVTSSWTDPVAGPRRHVYRITAAGRARLHEISALIAQTADAYSAFVHAHEQAMIRRAPGDGVDDTTIPVPREHSPDSPIERPAAASPPASQPLRPHGELLAGWLLLHLDAGVTYGYDLRREFAEGQRLTTDPGAVYRMLRRLEAAKWVQSRWTQSGAGPRRRIYRPTTRGRRNLDEIAEQIVVIRDAHVAYLDAYQHGRGPDDR